MSVAWHHRKRPHRQPVPRRIRASSVVHPRRPGPGWPRADTPIAIQRSPLRVGVLSLGPDSPPRHRPVLDRPAEASRSSSCARSNPRGTASGARRSSPADGRAPVDRARGPRVSRATVVRRVTGGHHRAHHSPGSVRPAPRTAGRPSASADVQRATRSWHCRPTSSTRQPEHGGRADVLRTSGRGRPPRRRCDRAAAPRAPATSESGPESTAVTA